MQKTAGTFIMMPQNETAARECLATCIVDRPDVTARVAELRNSIGSSLDIVKLLVADNTLFPIEEIYATGAEAEFYEAEAVYLEVISKLHIAEDNKIDQSKE